MPNRNMNKIDGLTITDEAVWINYYVKTGRLNDFKYYMLSSCLPLVSTTNHKTKMIEIKAKKA
jgi:hypothetical protein